MKKFALSVFALFALICHGILWEDVADSKKVVFSANDPFGLAISSNLQATVTGIPTIAVYGTNTANRLGLFATDTSNKFSIVSGRLDDHSSTLQGLATRIDSTETRQTDVEASLTETRVSVTGISSRVSTALQTSSNALTKAEQALAVVPGPDEPMVRAIVASSISPVSTLAAVANTNANTALARPMLTTNATKNIIGSVLDTNKVKRIYETDFALNPVFNTMSNGVFRQYYTVPAVTNNVITVSPRFNANGSVPPFGLNLGPIVFGESQVVDGWGYEFTIGIGASTYLVKGDCRWRVSTEEGRTILTPDPSTLAEGTGYVWPNGNTESFVTSDLFYAATSPVKYPLVFDGTAKYFPASAYIRNGSIVLEDNTFFGTPGRSELKVGANGKITLYNGGYISCTDLGSILIGSQGSLIIDTGDMGFRPGSTFSADQTDFQFYGSTIYIDEESFLAYKGYEVATLSDISPAIERIAVLEAKPTGITTNDVLPWLTISNNYSTNGNIRVFVSNGVFSIWSTK